MRSADINKLGVDATFIKGDIADRGQPEQFAIARETFAGFTAPHHAFLGNHDHYALLRRPGSRRLRVARPTARPAQPSTWAAGA